MQDYFPQRESRLPLKEADSQLPTLKMITALWPLTRRVNWSKRRIIVR